MFRKAAKRDKLKSQLAETDQQLAKLNAELAAQMIVLARKTGDLSPLKDAVKALQKARSQYSMTTAPRELAMVQQSLADTLLLLGRDLKDRDALLQARDIYRRAITLSSILSDEGLREELRANYKITQSLLGERRRVPSLFDAA